MKVTKERSSSVMEQNSILEDGKPAGGVEFERPIFGPKVLVVHEDSATASRAKEALMNVQDHLEIRTRFQTSLCRFDMLKDAEKAAPVLQQAKQADIVFLSLHGDWELPTGVCNWLLRWLETRESKPCALVVSFSLRSRMPFKCNSTWNFLRFITAPLEVDLFLHMGEPPFMAKCRKRSGKEREKEKLPFGFGRRITSLHPKNVPNYTSYPI